MCLALGHCEQVRDPIVIVNLTQSIKLRAYLPVIREDIGIPWMLIKIAAVHDAQTVETVHTDFAWTQSNDRAISLVNIIYRSILPLLESCPQDPKRSVRSQDMGVGYFGQGGQESRVDKKAIDQQQQREERREPDSRHGKVGIGHIAQAMRPSTSSTVYLQLPRV